jgi:hypothetical protein
VESLDGKQNVWTIRNDLAVPCALGVEIACSYRNVPTSDYEQPGALTIETLDDPAPYQHADQGWLKRFFAGPDVAITAAGAARTGAKASFTSSAEAIQPGGRCLSFTANNTGDRGGWCANGRRFPKLLDLSRYQAIGLWVHGDSKGETLQVQLRDAAGRAATWPVLVTFEGWRLCIFHKNQAQPGFDWSKIDSHLLWLQGIAGSTSVQVRLCGLRAIPSLHAMPELKQPAVQVNGRTVQFPIRMHSAQALTSEGPDRVRLWPGGMRPGQPVAVSTEILMLRPGDNRVTFTAGAAEDYPGDVNVLLYRLGPLSSK